jgi:hypothetical protein
LRHQQRARQQPQPQAQHLPQQLQVQLHGHVVPVRHQLRRELQRPEDPRRQGASAQPGPLRAGQHQQKPH